jgi:colanic acid/amylovoran biosynthesis protein
MIVEVRGAETNNKGAELMLRAILQALDGRHAVAVAPRVGSYDERARMGLLQKVVPPRGREHWLAAATRGLPAPTVRHLREHYGLVLDRDVGAVLDASGFAYSSRFDPHRTRVAADKFEHARRRGARTVLLPQAFGPFESEAQRQDVVRLVGHSDLVYAREPASLEHLRGTGCRLDHVTLAPDFTCLLDGRVHPGFEAPPRLAVVVPSMKLLTETSDAVRAAYVPFCARAVEILRAEGLDVRMLVHERGDAEVVDAVQARLERAVPVVRDESPEHLKGVIGQAEVVVGSRFHALVSALSQGVPALGVGWSHKYEMLFADYGVAEDVVDPSLDEAALGDRLRSMTEPGARRARVSRLEASAAQERDRCRAMWADVLGLLEAT